MARTRTAGGGGASAWALVIFGVGFGICLVLSILFYVQLQGAHQLADEAEQELRQFVTGPQASSPEVVRRLNNPQDGTVVQQLLDNHSVLRSLLTTDVDMDLEAIEARFVEGGFERPLLRGMENMQAELRDRSERIDQLEANLAEARELARSLDRRLTQATSSYDQSVQQLDGRLDGVSAEFTSYRGQVEQLERDLTQRVQQVHREREDRIIQLERERDEVRRETDQLQRALAEARQRDRAIAAPEFIRPDGRIASIGENEEVIHINLGRRDRIVAGMTFEVFSPNRPIEPSEQNQVRGKATLQVFEVGESASQSRVVRRQQVGREADRSISEGDHIVNIAYSPDTLYTFYVHGRFDIDATGEPTAVDRERIKSNIQRWGGRVVEELTYEVDFVVLGMEPELPEALPDGTIDPAAIRAHAEAERRYERHHEVIAAAEAHNIPVLNQNRFLALIGYFRR